MALRIGGPPMAPMAPTAPDAPVPDQIQAGQPAVEPDADDMTDAPTGAMVSPEVARYTGPEARCQSCAHFMSPGSCEVVTGPIDPQGICCIYTPDHEDESTPDSEAPESAPSPQE
jgi:hypothetical protein